MEIQRWKCRLNDITHEIIAAAIEVHRALGPGLLESVYEECLCRELSLRGIAFERQRPLQVEFKGLRLDCGFRLDLLVAERSQLKLRPSSRFCRFTRPNC